MPTIRIELSDWLQNAGIVGLVNILENEKQDYNLKQNYLEFDSSILNNFSTYYFKYFERRYIDHFSYSMIVNKGVGFLDTKDWNEQTLDKWNKYIETTKRLLTSNSYKAAYDMMPKQSINIVQFEKKLSKIRLKAKQTIDDVQDEINDGKNIIDTLIAYLKNEEVKKYIIAKNIAYSIIDKFWGNVSFLHKTSTKNDIFEEYLKYFIEPVFQYYEEEHKNDTYCCFTCSQPIKRLSKPHAYDLAWLNKMGVDMSRKTSHFWNLNSSTCYICPICNFVYSCIPAGFTVIHGQGYFVNCNNNIQKLVKLNNNSENLVLKEDETIRLAELKTYYQLLDYMEERKTHGAGKEIDNIQIIKFSSQTDAEQRRPFTFNILSKDKLQVIQRYKNSLSGFVNKIIKLNDDSYFNVFQGVLERLYQNRNQFDLIEMLCRNSLPSRAEEPMKRVKIIRELIYLNNAFIATINKNKGGSTSMNGYSSYVKRDTIKEIEEAGRSLAMAYSVRSASNKLSGITYRLLNALKTKDTGKFMDTFVNAYMYCGQAIPTKIIDVLQDEHKLQTMGYAFVIGLRSGVPESKEKGEE